ncbi:MAG: FAD:protein FMN transferase [Pseudomonadales bacterium]|nr:FAD:protein FMN transferase [Pseudomonadales bacterium]
MPKLRSSAAWGWGLSALLLVVLVVFARQSGNEKSSRTLSVSGLTMGTSWQVLVPEDPRLPEPTALAVRIQALLDRLDRELMSTYAKDSQLSQFNRNPPNQAFPVAAELLDVIAVAQEVQRLSAGAFDITVGPLVDLWGFGPVPTSQLSRIPAPAELERARAMLGSDKLLLSRESSSLLKQQALRVDLSGIAKGYAVDQVAEYLDALALPAYLVEIGGELKMKGKKPGQGEWITAIEMPEHGMRQVFTTFRSKGQTLAVAGSGDYRNFFEQDGRRYSHEIDPRSGLPISHDLAAVTVVDNSATRADAFATALMVLGPEAGFELANGLGLAAYFIMRHGKILESRYTDGFAAYL